MTWDATAPVGFVNSGTFTVSADWYDGDPLAAGNFLDFAPDRSASYSAAAPSPAPEPGAWLLFASGLLALGLWKRKRRLED